MLMPWPTRWGTLAMSCVAIGSYGSAWPGTIRGTGEGRNFGAARAAVADPPRDDRSRPDLRGFRSLLSSRGLDALAGGRPQADRHEREPGNGQQRDGLP